MGGKKGSLQISPSKKASKADAIDLTNFNNLTDVPTKKVTDNTAQPLSRMKFILSEIKQMKVNLIMFLYILAHSLRRVSSTTLIIDKVCLVHLNYSDAICSNLSFYQEMKTEVVRLGTNYQLGYNFLTFLPSAVLVCFIGSWSDKYSRKIPLIVTLVGTVIDDVGTTFCAVFIESRVEMLYLSAIFSGFSGGFLVVVTVLFSFISDISTPENRTMKYALLQAAFGFSMPFGVIIGGQIFKYYGYVPVFLTATSGHILALFLIVFLLEETRGLENKEPWSVKFCKLWSTETVIASFKATTKQRPNKGRKQILLLLICSSIVALRRAANTTVGFAYVHHLFDWNNTKFSTVFGIFSMMGTIVILFVVPLLKRFKLQEIILGFMGSISMIGQDIAYGFASNEYIYYAANFVGLVDNLLSLACRTRISKLVSKDEIGKIFSFLSTAESIVPILVTIALTQGFNATLDIFPGLIFLIIGTLSLIPLIIFIWISRLPNDKNDTPETSKEEISRKHSNPTRF